jgi:hypothetical protein
LTKGAIVADEQDLAKRADELLAKYTEQLAQLFGEVAAGAVTVEWAADHVRSGFGDLRFMFKSLADRLASAEGQRDKAEAERDACREQLARIN